MRANVKFWLLGKALAASHHVHLRHGLVSSWFCQTLDEKTGEGRKKLSADCCEPSQPRLARTSPTGNPAPSGDHLTLSEVVQVREKDVSVVARGEPLEVVLGHLAQLLPVDVLEQQDIDVRKAIFFHCPLQPLPDVVRTPQCRIWKGMEHNRSTPKETFPGCSHLPDGIPGSHDFPERPLFLLCQKKGL